MDVYSVDEKNKDKYITIQDIYTYTGLIVYVLNNVFPKYVNIHKYTKDIANICLKLNIAIP